MTGRGRRLYDRWSRHPRLLDLLYGVVFLGREAERRRESVAALELSAGDAVLELGCGTGNGFERLRGAVGPSGGVVGVDASAGMVERAAGRIRDRGWSNVHVVRADAASPGLAGEAFDAVYAAMSLSATDDPRAALAAARDCLRPGGRVAVLDARPFPAFPLSTANALLEPLFARTTDWHPAVDVVDAIESVFGPPSVRTHVGGAVVLASAGKSSEP